jgi:hypothetical protein
MNHIPHIPFTPIPVYKNGLWLGICTNDAEWVNFRLLVVQEHLDQLDSDTTPYEIEWQGVRHPVLADGILDPWPELPDDAHYKANCGIVKAQAVRYRKQVESGIRYWERKNK